MSCFRHVTWQRIVLMALLFVGFFRPVNAYSQQYEPLLNGFNEWHFTNCYFGCLTDTYFTNGDTIVNDTFYKVLDGFHYISRSFLLREDQSARRVFLRKTEVDGTSQEYLLYDFSMSVGDSIEMSNPITPFPQNAGYFIVDSIISRPLVNGNEYRHFYMSPSPSNQSSNNTCVWIEGVGSLSLINAPSGFPDINQVGALSCFFKNGIPFYTNLDSISSCAPLLAQPELNIKPKFIGVYNKSLGVLSLKNVQDMTRLLLTDFRGRVIENRAINNLQTLDWALGALSSGLYFVNGRNKDGQWAALKFMSP
ncbi:hypothetical protein N9L39_00365 [Flavobacteriaceae bacterium]|nr:hypothetical protein [Flavobacteriaceae bacterium]